MSDDARDMLCRYVAVILRDRSTVDENVFSIVFTKEVWSAKTIVYHM